MSPFILEGGKKLPPEPAASSEEEYDQYRQLWIDRNSQEPLVSRLHREIEASQYGETSLTETREGADQADSAFQASSYGETTVTKTREGADMTEASAWDTSSYGETIKTATREGADQPDSAMRASSYGETIETRTREGADQTEISAATDSGPIATALLGAGPDSAQLFSGRMTDAPHPHF
jgi:hypothetical protein